MSVCGDIGLDLELCVGQAYDGASNMSGHIRGAAKLIQDKYPRAIYQHCQSHALNLALMKSCTSIAQLSMS